MALLFERAANEVLAAAPETESWRFLFLDVN